jgi:Raf kinase inhibitor-like YbhB/YbcL family protein
MKISRKMLSAILSVCMIASIVLAQEKMEVDSAKQKSEVKMKVESPAFKEGDTIPAKYTCDGNDISPALLFSGIPTGTKTLALICDDPDAPSGDWVHWVIYNMSADLKGLPENISLGVSSINIIDKKEIALHHGKTDFGKYGYGGPCPPKGGPHRYYFKLYALDIKIDFTLEDVKRGITKKILLERMSDHIIDEAHLMGKYQRK